MRRLTRRRRRRQHTLSRPWRALVNHLIGKMYSLERNIILSKDSKHVDIINKARGASVRALEDTLTIQEIAQETGHQLFVVTASSSRSIQASLRHSTSRT